jgi:hypothetical protein
MKPLIYFILLIIILFGIHHAFNYSIYLGLGIIALIIFGIYKYFTK